MKNLPLLIGTIVTTLILIVGVAVVFSGSDSDSGRYVEVGTLIEGAQNTQGDPEAKVVIVEFSDFQCPACQGAETFVDAVREQYSDQIFLVYHHFPLIQIHPYAMIAAQFAELAADEGKFWPAHDLLFSRQEEWSSLRSEDEVLAQFESYLSELDIDKTDFSSRIQSKEIKDRVNGELSLSQQLNISATPTFFVNGQQTPAQELMTKVESVLAETE